MVAPLLVSAAAGYWVLTQSAGQKGKVKTLGQWLGLIIIIVSVLGAACKVYCMTTNCPMGMRGGKMACPFTGQKAPVSAPQ